MAEDQPLKKYIRKYKRTGNHVRRYLFIRKFTKGKDVIEFGCGYGAGSTIMKDNFNSYLGIDIDKQAINYAKANIQPLHNNVKFALLSEFQNHEQIIKSDIAICFEVLEHVKDPRSLLAFLVSITKNNGLIILSTPNGLSSRGNRELYRTPYHINEFTPQQFVELLSEQGDSEIYGERRIDKMDLSALSARLHDNKIKGSHKTNSEAVPLSRKNWNRAVAFGYKYINRSLFWKIYKTSLEHEQSQLNSSTLVAILKPQQR